LARRLFDVRAYRSLLIVGGGKIGKAGSSDGSEPMGRVQRILSI